MSNILDQKAAFENAGYSYGYGGNGSDGTIDCSQLVNQMVRSSGYDVPYQNTAALQSSPYYEEVDPAEVQPGDILLWRGNNNHVGVVNDYDPDTGLGTFFGSQSSTGPATASFGKGYWKAPTVFLRPSSKYYKGAICLPKYSQPDPLQKSYSGNTRPSPVCNSNFRASQASGSPLILDLDGDGIEITQRSDTRPILFDLNADGIRTNFAWAAADDGLLVLDRDGNGRIDNGSELFGDHTVLANGQKASDGYVALRDLDSNQDGMVTSHDAQYANLQVWRDLDQDGVSDAGELATLAQSGITQIDLTKTASTQTLPDGTRLDGSASFTLDGQTRRYTDAWFAENPFYSEFTTPIAVGDALLALPDMHGSGAVRDLRQAASLSPALHALLTQFQSAPTRAAQLALIDPLLKACLLYTSPSPRDRTRSRMPSSA